jgi:serine/threonine protein kinase
VCFFFFPTNKMDSSYDFEEEDFFFDPENIPVEEDPMLNDTEEIDSSDSEDSLDNVFARFEFAPVKPEAGRQTPPQSPKNANVAPLRKMSVDEVDRVIVELYALLPIEDKWKMGRIAHALGRPANDAKALNDRRWSLQHFPPTITPSKDRMKFQTVVHFFNLNTYKWDAMVASKLTWNDKVDAYPMNPYLNSQEGQLQLQHGQLQLQHVLFQRLLRIKVVPFPQADIEALTNVVRQRFHMKEFNGGFPTFEEFGSMKAMYAFDYRQQQVYLRQRLMKKISTLHSEPFILAGAFVNRVFVLRVFPVYLQVTFVIDGKSETSMRAHDTPFLRLVEAVEATYPNVEAFYVQGYDDRYFTETTTVLDIAKATNQPISCTVVQMLQGGVKRTTGLHQTLPAVYTILNDIRNNYDFNNDVILVQHDETKEKVVAKKFWKGQMWKQEKKALETLKHPHILPLLASVPKDASSLEFCTQGSYLLYPAAAMDLFDYLQKPKATTLEDRLQIFMQLLDAIHHTHQNKFAHCDLKPANILIQYPQEGKRGSHIWLADWGFNESQDERESLTGYTWKGTPGYASPQLLHVGMRTLRMEKKDIPEALNWQTTGSSYDMYLADAWALGAILVNLLFNQAAMHRIRTPLFWEDMVHLKRNHWEHFWNRWDPKQASAPNPYQQMTEADRAMYKTWVQGLLAYEEQDRWSIETLYRHATQDTLPQPGFVTKPEFQRIVQEMQAQGYRQTKPVVVQVALNLGLLKEDNNFQQKVEGYLGGTPASFGRWKWTNPLSSKKAV